MYTLGATNAGDHATKSNFLIWSREFLEEYYEGAYLRATTSIPSALLASKNLFYIFSIFTLSSYTMSNVATFIPIYIASISLYVFSAVALNDGFQHIPDNTDFMNPNPKSVVIVVVYLLVLRRNFRQGT